MDYPQNFIIFLHIHKCAGLSFKRLLRKEFGPTFIDRIKNRLGGQRPQPLLAALKCSSHKDGYFAGHFGFGVHEHLPSPAKYVTFLRDPIKRLISLYEYSRSTPRSFYFEQARHRTFEEFVQGGAVFETDNGMVRFLIGDLDKVDYYICRKPFGSLTDADLQTAISNFKKFFAIPGITEQFDRSLLLLKSELGLASVKYLRLNERTPSDCVETKWNTELEPFVALDRKLYQWALNQNERSWDGLLRECPSAITEFQLINEKYRRFRQRPYDFYFRLRNKLYL